MQCFSGLEIYIHIYIITIRATVVVFYLFNFRRWSPDPSTSLAVTVPSSLSCLRFWTTVQFAGSLGGECSRSCWLRWSFGVLVLWVGILLLIFVRSSSRVGCRGSVVNAPFVIRFTVTNSHPPRPTLRIGCRCLRSRWDTWMFFALIAVCFFQNWFLRGEESLSMRVRRAVALICNTK